MVGENWLKRKEGLQTFVDMTVILKPKICRILIFRPINKMASDFDIEKPIPASIREREATGETRLGGNENRLTDSGLFPHTLPHHQCFCENRHRLVLVKY